VRARFDIDRLDPDDPFEIDERNLPHLYKHLPIREGRHVPVGVEDLKDMYVVGDPIFEPASEDGRADWIMIGEVPGLVLVVPLASSRSGDPRQCRPIGIYAATEAERRRYLEGR